MNRSANNINIQQDVELNPTLNSGKVLRWLSLELLKVDTRQKAAN